MVNMVVVTNFRATPEAFAFLRFVLMLYVISGMCTLGSKF